MIEIGDDCIFDHSLWPHKCEMCEVEESVCYWLDPIVGSGEFMGVSCIRTILAPRSFELELRTPEEGAFPMREATTNPAKRSEFPETYQLEVGDTMIACALEIRPNVKTKYGPRTVIECVVRGADAAKTWTFWWPSKVAVLPAIHGAFMVHRTEKNEYRVLCADTADEATKLWEQGKVDAPAIGAQQRSLPGFVK